MRVLVTAGSTQTPIDQVRCISNIFKGKTGGSIAQYFAKHGTITTLLTSADSETWYRGMEGDHNAPFRDRLSVNQYQTFDELAKLMELEITTVKYDVIVHSAAVSDFQVGKVLSDAGNVDKSAKISSSHQKLYLELTPTIKLIDQIRKPWGFTGKLVKFKLQVGISDLELLAIARKSRQDSRADIIVANCLEWSRERAYIIDAQDQVKSVTRQELPAVLYEMLR